MILQDYLAYTEKSASPESYHVWTFLSMISSILGKRIFIRCNYFNVYPNMYIILASAPGVGKKSTAMRIGRSMVDEADLEPKVKYSNDSQTPQALMLELEKAWTIAPIPSNGKMFASSALTILASELVSLLVSGPAMVDFLTDIYDSDHKFEYKTKNAGRVTINNPCLNIMAGVTTDSLNARVIRDATAGGFMSRALIIYDNKTRPSSAFDMPDDNHEDARQRVIDRFKRVNELYGEMSFTKAALKDYQEFERKEEQSLQTNPMHIEFRSRKPIHTLKAAMIIAASELDMTINDLHIHAAIELLNRVEDNMQHIHISSGNHKNAEIHSRIILALGKVQKLDYHDMLAHFMSSTDEETFDKSIQTLINVRWITMTTDTTVKPPKQYLKLTPKGTEMFFKYK